MSQDVNIYDTANQLVRDLTHSSQFKQLEKAIETVKSNEESKQLFSDFQALQERISQQQVQGKELDPDDLEKMQDLSAQMSENDQLSHLIEVEQQMNALISDINRIVVQPISKLYE